MKRSPLEEAQLKLSGRKWDSDYHFSHNEAKREFTTSTDSGERASDECLGDYDDDIEYSSIRLCNEIALLSYLLLFALRHLLPSLGGISFLILPHWISTPIWNCDMQYLSGFCGV